jgi:2OG-Fe(II) oxygenase superfamily
VRVRITRRGALVDVSASEMKELQRQFQETYCVLIRQFVEPSLLALLQDKIAAAGFYDKHNVDVGDEVRMQADPAGTALEFMMNDPVLHAFIREVSGIGSIGAYRGRVYSLLPNTGMMSDWHNDMVPGRMATMVINLSTQVYEGGLLQFKHVDSDEIVTSVHNTGFGDATLFKIDYSLKHRVTPITGTARRTMYAGWFLNEPDFVTLLKDRIETQSVEA